VARTRAQAAKFFDGLELAEPGLSLVQYWHPDVDAPVAENETGLYAGVARKP
jgi:hypothetical protein